MRTARSRGASGRIRDRADAGVAAVDGDECGLSAFPVNIGCCPLRSGSGHLEVGAVFLSDGPQRRRRGVEVAVGHRLGVRAPHQCSDSSSCAAPGFTDVDETVIGRVPNPVEPRRGREAAECAGLGVERAPVAPRETEPITCGDGSGDTNCSLTD
jgi:hypothetical protein